MPTETIRSLRSRTRSIAGTQKIARAMYLSSSAKFTRAVKQMETARSCRNQAAAMLDLLIPCLPIYPQTGRICRIVIAGDRGMAGGYNAAILNSISFDDKTWYLPIGRKAFEKICRANAENLLTEAIPSEKTTYWDLKPRIDIITSLLTNGKINCLEIAYTAMNGDIRTERIFPGKAACKTCNSIIFEPPADEIISKKLSSLITAIVYGIMLEAHAREYLSRRTAMETARKNAEKMMEDINIKINRMRQAGITQEIIETTAGFGKKDGGH